MNTFQAAALLVLASQASAAQFTKTSASVGHPFLRYDAFLFDGGVLHDNVNAKPYAAKAIEALQAAGKLVIIGSNAPHPNDDELAFLQRLGVANLATALEYAKLNDDVPMVSSSPRPRRREGCAALVLLWRPAARARRVAGGTRAVAPTGRPN